MATSYGPGSKRPICQHTTPTCEYVKNQNFPFYRQIVISEKYCYEILYFTATENLTFAVTKYIQNRYENVNFRNDNLHLGSIQKF